MNRSLFDFSPAAWLPTQDKTVLEYCRNIKREEMEITNENGYSIRVVPHPCSAITAELFNWVYRGDVEDKKTVIVFPNSWRTVYTAAAEMCNRYNVSARNIHAFCMDEYADENGNVADIQAEDGVYTEYRLDLTHTVVHNSKGVVLPSTGGMGTFWLITIGTLLAIGFAVFLITHKKMSVYTD